MGTKALEAKQATGTTSKKEGDGAVVETTEQVGDPIITDKPLCNVGVRQGVTINMGNYNSAKLEVSLFIPCDAAEVDEAFLIAKNWTDEKLQGMVTELQEANPPTE